MAEETNTTAPQSQFTPRRRGTRYDSRVEIVDSTLLYYKCPGRLGESSPPNPVEKCVGDTGRTSLQEETP